MSDKKLKQEIEKILDNNIYLVNDELQENKDEIAGFMIYRSRVIVNLLTLFKKYAKSYARDLVPRKKKMIEGQTSYVRGKIIGSWHCRQEMLDKLKEIK